MDLKNPTEEISQTGKVIKAIKNRNFKELFYLTTHQETLIKRTEFLNQDKIVKNEIRVILKYKNKIVISISKHIENNFKPEISYRLNEDMEGIEGNLNL